MAFSRSIVYKITRPQLVYNLNLDDGTSVQLILVYYGVSWSNESWCRCSLVWMRRIIPSAGHKDVAAPHQDTSLTPILTAPKRQVPCSMSCSMSSYPLWKPNNTLSHTHTPKKKGENTCQTTINRWSYLRIAEPHSRKTDVSFLLSCFLFLFLIFPLAMQLYGRHIPFGFVSSVKIFQFLPFGSFHRGLILFFIFFRFFKISWIVLLAQQVLSDLIKFNTIL